MPADYVDHLRLFLVAFRFPYYEEHVSQADVLLGTTARVDLSSPRGAIIGYAAELRGKRHDELERMATEARATVRLLAMHEHELNHLIPDLSSDYRAADFSYWSSFTSWTPEEAAALTLGADPRHCDREKLQKLAGKVQFAAQFSDTISVIERAQLDAVFDDRIAPFLFLDWAKDRFDLPGELVDAVRAARPNETRERSARAGGSERSDEIHPKRRRSFFTLIQGIARTRYGHQPGNARNSTASQMVRDCAAAGYSIDEKTVRSILSSADECCEPRG
jgi:hypothetical protein